MTLYLQWTTYLTQLWQPLYSVICFFVKKGQKAQANLIACNVVTVSVYKDYKKGKKGKRPSCDARNYYFMK